MSGWRRITPVPEQGTSSRIRSNGRPSHQAAGWTQSPTTTCAGRRSRARFDSMRVARAASIVERDQLGKAGLELGDVAGLAARCRAGVEHAHAGRRRQQARRELGGGVLHGNLSVRKAGQRVHGGRLGEPQRLRRKCARLGREPRSDEPREVGVARAAPCVDAQPHRRLDIARRRDRLPVARPVARESVQHPFRVGMACATVGVRRRDHRTRARAGIAAAPRSRAPPRAGGRARAPPRRSPRRRHAQASRHAAAGTARPASARALPGPASRPACRGVPRGNPRARSTSARSRRPATASPGAARRLPSPRRPHPRVGVRASRPRPRRAPLRRGSRRRRRCSRRGPCRPASRALASSHARDHAPARQLHAEQPEGAVAGHDGDARRVRADDGARDRAVARRHDLGLVDAQLRAVQRRLRDRPRVERPHAPLELLGRVAPVEPRLGFRQLGGVSRTRLVLRLESRATCRERVERRDERRAALPGEPLFQLAGGLACARSASRGRASPDRCRAPPPCA